MPVLSECSYCAPFWLPGGDAQTVGPRLICFVPAIAFSREQMELEDGDFLLVDWLYASGNAETVSDRLAILSHGLEGDSTRSYMRAAALALARRGWDIASRNFRGCGGPINRLPALYHSGDVADLDAVVRHARRKGYRRIALVGFSMGGNQVLKYLGERADVLPDEIVRAAAVSVPCDLVGCSMQLSKARNRMYMEYFLCTLRRKIREKRAMYPDLFDVRRLDAMKTFKEFDDSFTAPLNGFANAEDYWARASSRPHLGRIRVPTLVINAGNDPFLSETCFPFAEAKASQSLHLLTPKQGGHVGFPTFLGKTVGWLEMTIAAFFDGKPVT